MDILLDDFSRGKRPLPIRGSFFASIGLNPFIKKGKITSKHFLHNETNNTLLEDLGMVDNFAKTNISGLSSSIMVKSGAGIFEENERTWTKVHTISVSCTASKLEMATEPHKGNLHYCSNEYVGKFDGSVWLDTWKSGLTNIYHYMLSIRNKVLISNGQYIAGWSTESGSDWSTALLDLQPGYNSKRMVMKKVSGTRQALIQGQYDTDRSKDGIFIWDTTSDSPVDFIPVPYMHDMFVENDIVYVLSGSQVDISIVVGTQLQYLNSVFDEPIMWVTGSAYFSISFLCKFSNLILLNIGVQRNKNITGDNFYPGLWAYNVENNSLFYWMPPSNGNLYNVIIGGAYVEQPNVGIFTSEIGQNLWIASKITDAGSPVYRIDGLYKIITYGGGGIYREMLVSPILSGGIATKIWNKVKSAHNMLLTTARILFKYRDFSRDLVSHQGALTSTISATTFKLTTSVGEVGDEVTVLAGTGAGQVRHIIGIAGSGDPYTYTIDEAWDTNPVVANAIIEIASWKKMSETSAITNKEKDGRKLIFSQRGISTQIKLIFEHPDEQNIDLHALKISGTEEKEI